MVGSASRNKQRTTMLINSVLAVICILWTIPTVGLLVSSFRNRFDIQTSGWWTILPHRGSEIVNEYKPETPPDWNAGEVEIQAIGLLANPIRSEGV